MEKNRQTLRDFMKANDLKMAPWARAAGVSEGALRNFLAGRSNSLNGETLTKLANAANAVISLQGAVLKILAKEENLQPSGLIPAKVIGYVQAGNWGEAHEFLEEDQELFTVDAEFKDENIYGLKVVGKSMDKEYKEGCILHCVDFDPYNDTLKHGDHVIVNAICVADEIETTVKEYQIEDGKEYLVPQSNSVEYKSPYSFPVKEEDNVFINGRKIKEICIKAIVVGHYYRRNR